jgi:hypothetical protein
VEFGGKHRGLALQPNSAGRAKTTPGQRVQVLLFGCGEGREASFLRTLGRRWLRCRLGLNSRDIVNINGKFTRSHRERMSGVSERAVVGLGMNRACGRSVSEQMVRARLRHARNIRFGSCRRVSAHVIGMSALPAQANVWEATGFFHFLFTVGNAEETLCAPACVLISLFLFCGWLIAGNSLTASSANPEDHFPSSSLLLPLAPSAEQEAPPMGAI